MNSDQPIFVECPHCNVWIEIEALNCCIFRHHKDLGPHADKATCDAKREEDDKARANGKDVISGCCNPFKIEISTASGGEKTYKAVTCDYI